MKHLNIDSIDELGQAAEEILASLEERHIIIFRGEMGAGKTTLIREICALMGVGETVTSPTFALVNEYKAEDGASLFHFDFYRINRIEEAFDLGYEEYFYGDGLCLVEWPEKIEALLPDDVLTVGIQITGNNSRLITIS